jgi:hypothetical protein
MSRIKGKEIIENITPIANKFKDVLISAAKVAKEKIKKGKDITLFHLDTLQ